jgi:hypothetical protein
MVVTPKQLEKMTKSEETQLKTLEKKIDAKLRKHFVSSTNNTIYLDISKEATYGTRVYSKLIEMYEIAGWTVKYESNQRDGDYLVFKPRGERE